MNERRIRIARMLLTVPALFLALGPPVADFNATHAMNPLWPGHARLHMVWLVCTNGLVALLALGILWRQRQAPTAGAVQLGAALIGAILLGFFLAAAFQGAYGGTFSDPNGIPVRVGPLDANLFAFSVCAAAVAVAAALTRRPGEARGGG